MNTYITNIQAREILDSRGNPTVETEVTLADGSKGKFSVPSGASKGIHEALELRDNDLSRFHGMGVLTACQNVNTVIKEALLSFDALDQKAIDYKMIELDGSENKSKLGANAILSVSLAVARAAAISQNRELFNYLFSLFSKDYHSNLDSNLRIPIPLFNVLNGGAHADNNISIQEFMIIPKGIKGFCEQVRAASEIDWTLKGLLRERGAISSFGDEGGFAPNLPSDETAIEMIIEACEKSNYKVPEEIVIGLDIAASNFYEADDDVYAIPNIDKNGKTLVDNSKNLSKFYANLLEKYPIFLIEDAMSEDDWNGWKELSKTISFERFLVVGDDLITSNPKRLQKAIDEKVVNAVIIKPNQIGTLTEVFELIDLANKNNITKIISHRSGETTDTFIADLAVGIGSSYFKNGAPVRGERVVKYNRVMEIEQILNKTT